MIALVQASRNALLTGTDTAVIMGGRFKSWEGPLVYKKTEPKLSLIVQYLRQGKSPKEIAFILKRAHHIDCSEWAMWKMLKRHPQARLVYVETYPLRYPRHEDPPAKVKTILQAIVQ